MLFLLNFNIYTFYEKEDLLSDEFLKQFKTGEDLYGFLAQLQKRGLEKMLEGVKCPFGL